MLTDGVCICDDESVKPTDLTVRVGCEHDNGGEGARLARQLAAVCPAREILLRALSFRDCFKNSDAKNNASNTILPELSVAHMLITKIYRSW